ncbi:MAG: prefoldin subunit alpha [Candidatus Heimdallarchaeota archaeon]|nr:prefoldin subunit alpha [Candidatus Heimdallarchaeota archaeon]MCK4955244.1 prefoldin subunit alpha [Candidatus Heimdallarchaeota archaeon]
MSENTSADKISKEEVNNLLLAAQQLEQQANRYNQQMEILNNYYNEIQNAEQTLSELTNSKENKKVLFPIGAGNFIYATVQDTEKIIVTIGAGVHSEKSLDHAIDGLKKKKSEVETQITQIKASYNEVIERLREIDRLVKSVM